MRFFCFGLIHLFSSMALATSPNFPASAVEQWHSFFSGSPFLMDPRNDMAKVLHVPKECSKSVQKILTYVTDYGYAASRSDNTQAEKIYSRIRKSLSAEGPDCTDILAKSYIVGSMALINPSSWDYLPDSNKELSVGTPPNLFISMVAAYLVNKGYIELSEFDLSADRKILGAYDCENSKIYIDVNLRPIDLASLVIHEMDHLFRDKSNFSPWSDKDLEISASRGLELLKDFSKIFINPEDVFETLSSRLNKSLENFRENRMKAEILLDETLATLVSSHFQISLQTARVDNGYFRPGFLGGLFQKSVTKPVEKTFAIQNDITFYDRNGLLSKLWKKETHPYRFLSSNFLKYPEFVNDSFLNPGDEESSDWFYLLYSKMTSDYKKNQNAFLIKYPEIEDPYSLQEIIRVHVDTRSAPPRGSVEALYKKVFSVYFPNQNLSEDVLPMLAPGLLKLGLSPLVEQDVFTEHRARQSAKNDRVKIISNDLSFPGLGVSTELTQRLMVETLKTIGHLEERMNKVSPYCQRFSDWSQSGKLDGYLGLSPIHLGGAGVRPGGSGVRPGGSGVRPGGAGVRPGGSGLRPSSALKLCISPGSI